LVIVALASIGYYQYVYTPSALTSTTTTTSPTEKVVQINITVGAASKIDDAYAPNPVTLVIGVNNTFVVYNGDIQNGVGVPHSYTDRGNAFNTGVIQGGDTSSAIKVTTPGTYNVYCVVHPSTMKGVLRVIQGGGGITSSSTTRTSTSTTSVNSTSRTNSSTSSVAGAGVIIVSGAGANTNSAGYSPSSITVVIGVNDTVTWKNMDTAPHTVTAKDGTFDSGNLDSGQSYTHTFTTPGTYQIFCKYHSWMHGTVTVKAKS
jgi:plastocyanin